MPNKQLSVTTETDSLIVRWKEAKQAETAWNALRKEIEENIKKENGDFQGLLDSIGDEALTTTAGLGDLDVTVGYTMKADQAAVAQFLATYPAMVNILFKLEYKPVAKAVLAVMNKKDPMGEAMKAAISFVTKATGFRAR